MVCIGLINKNTVFKYFEFDNEWLNIHNIEIGELFIETTAEFEFCSLSGHYTKNDSSIYGFFNHIGDDYSEYDQKLCNNGGAYGYDFYCLMAIEEVSIARYESDNDVDVEIDIEEISTTSCDVMDVEFDIEELEEIEELLSI